MQRITRLITPSIRLMSSQSLSSLSLSSSLTIEIKSTVKCFGGKLIRFTHQSDQTQTPMTCAVYLPSLPHEASDSSDFKFPGEYLMIYSRN